MNDPDNLLHPESEGSAISLQNKMMDQWEQRLYPSGDPAVVQQAILEYLPWIEGHPKDIGEFPSTWTALGPLDTPTLDPVGSAGQISGTGTGQIHAIAFDPGYGAMNSTLYCASGMGGLFKSTDAGDSWTAMTDHSFPFGAVADVLVVPTDPDVLIVATGASDGWNYCTGLWRSGNAGVDWENISVALISGISTVFNIFNALMVPSDPNMIFIATTAGIFRTSNALDPDPAAVTWTQVFAPPGETYLKGLELKPNNENVIYASGRNIWMSVDQGINWSSLTDPPYVGLDFDIAPWNVGNHVPSRINLAVTVTAPEKLYALVSTGINYGAGSVSYALTFDATLPINWTNASVVQSADEFVSPGWVGLAASPSNPGVVAYGSSEIHRTSDGGATIEYFDTYWDQVHADTHVIAWSPDGGELWVGHDGGLSMTADPYHTPATNATWVGRNSGLAVSWIYQMSSNPADRYAVMMGAQDDGVNRLDPQIIGSNKWMHLLTGDGSATLFSPDGEHAYGRDYRNMNFTKWRNGFTTYGSYDPASTLDDGLPGNAPGPPYEGIGAWTHYNHIPFYLDVTDGRMYVCYSDIWKEGDVDAAATDMEWNHIRLAIVQGDGFSFPCNSQGMRDGEIAPSSGEHMYFITPARGNNADCPGGQPSRFFRTRIPPVYIPEPSFEEASGSLPSTAVAISGIAVDPDDPLHVFMAYSGYEGGVKVFESYDGGDPGSWINMDPGPAHELPNLPVNDIVFHSGSDGGIYIAMDVGVYYWSYNTDGWEPFFTELPNVQVNDIDINYCAGKIRAATAGRGVWESDLAEWPVHVKEIDDDMTWDKHQNLTRDITVKNGSTLTITSTANFSPGTKLIIEPGAKVDLNGGTLTNLCGNFWKGVEVLGDPNQSQIPMTNQGYLLMRNGAVIENAEVGVSLFGTDEDGNLIPQSEGGVVRGYSSTIRNCKRQVWMRKYKNMYNGIEYPNRSKFQNTDFLLTVDYDQTASYPDMVRLEGVKDIQFSSCEFQYQHEVEAGLARPIGIRSYNSSFTVAGNSGFWWLSAGVRGYDYSGMKPCYIRDSQFKYNDRGVILTGVNNAEITGNTFDVPTGDGSWPLDQSMPPWPIPYGVYLYGCAGYEVEDNMMTGVNYIGNVGLTIKKSDQVADAFYRNDFANLYVGSLMQGNNQFGADGEGLQFRCNVYGNEDGTNECIYSAAATENDAAIAENQGSPAKPIGNRFYPDCPGGVETEVYFDGDSPDGLLYHHHLEPETRPDCSTPPPHVTLSNTSFPFIPGDGPVSSCPEDPSVITGTGEVKAAFQGAVGDHVQLKALYDGELDGGDTDYLLDQIHDPLVSSFNLRNLLLASMPVKDAVLLAALYREPAMDPWHLTQVMLDASPLNPDVLLAVMSSWLDESYKIMIREQQEEEEYSWKQWIEAELGCLRHDVERARHDYVRKVLQDTVGNPLDSILLVLADADMPATPPERLWLLMAKDEWQVVDEWISDPGGHGLTLDQAAAFDVVRDVMLDPENATAIVQDAQQLLGAMASDESNSSHLVARALLAAHLDLSFEEPMVLPGEERSAIEGVASSPMSSRGLIRVQPNPASTRALVVTHLPMGHAIGWVSLYNSYGVELERTQVRSGPFIVELDLTMYSSGLYRVVLFGGRDEMLDGVSLTIAR